jgi:hypothetical protein
VSFRLRFVPPTVGPSGDPADLDDALYGLGDAGATAEIALADYRLALYGTGLVELADGCRSLLAIADGGPPRETDQGLRELIPQAPRDAAFDQWAFPVRMTNIPVLVFAVTPRDTWIATLTHMESEGFPLGVLPDRDLPEPVCVPTGEVVAQAGGYLKDVHAAARAAFPRARLP